VSVKVVKSRNEIMLIAAYLWAWLETSLAMANTRAEKMSGPPPMKVNKVASQTSRREKNFGNKPVEDSYTC
jgi:hypothetical protein